MGSPYTKGGQFALVHEVDADEDCDVDSLIAVKELPAVDRDLDQRWEAIDRPGKEGEEAIQRELKAPGAVTIMS